MAFSPFTTTQSGRKSLAQQRQVECNRIAPGFAQHIAQKDQPHLISLFFRHDEIQLLVMVVMGHAVNFLYRIGNANRHNGLAGSRSISSVRS